MRKLLEKIGFSKLGDNYKNKKKETITHYHYDEKNISQKNIKMN